MKSERYYEAHITLKEWISFKTFLNICNDNGWRGSRFDQVDDYDGKWFMSTRGEDLEEMKTQMKETVEGLEKLGMTVLRWKIEDTLLDSKLGDTL